MIAPELQARRINKKANLHQSLQKPSRKRSSASGSMICSPAAAWGVAVELFGWVCPLTPLESALRRAGGGTGYSAGFIEQYIVPLVYPTELTRNLQLVLGAIVVVVNVVVYVLILRRQRRRTDR